MGCRCMEIPVERRGMNPKADLQLYYRYVAVLRRERPDRVLLFSIKPNIYGGYACRRLKIPFFAHVQGLGSAFYRPALKPIVVRMYKTALKTAQKVFFENTNDARCFVRYGMIPQGKAFILPGAGVDLAYFSPLSYPDETKGICFLFAGRIMKEKGVEELFAAAREIKRLYGSRVRFEWVGPFEEDYRAELERLSSEGIVTYFGFQEDLRPFYQRAHCVVLPSYHEGMSNVLLEGAACARALITTDVPGCREAVEQGKSGLLCEKGDVKTLTACLGAFLNMRTSERRAMGERGRRHVEKYFDRREVIERTVKVLRNPGNFEIFE